MFVETGLCRAKNAAHTAAMNLMIYPLGCLAFWVYGFAIGWGNWWNGPVPPGWYPSLGPGLSVLNEGWGLGAAVDAAGQGDRRVHVRAHRHEGLVFDRCRRRRRRDGAVLLHDGVHGHHRDDPDRRDGRALGMEELLPLRPVGRAAVLPLRQLGLGRRLARSGRHQLGPRPWRRRLRRLGRRALRWAASSRSRAPWSSARASASTIRRASRRRCRATMCRWSCWARSSWPSAGSASTPARRLPGTDLRISFVVVNTMLASITGALARHGHAHAEGPQARSDDDVQRHARRPRGDHGALRVRRSVGGGVIGAVAGVLVVVSVFFWEARGVDDPVGRDLGPRRERPLGRASRSASSPPASTAPAGTASCVKRW